MFEADPPDPVKVARKFLVFALESSSPSDSGLLAFLDELSHVYLFGMTAELLDDGTEDHDPPKRADNNYQDLCEKLSGRFPSLGFYPVANLFEPDKWELFTGDAIDDIADITADLQEVVWLAENNNETVARWHFRMLFEIHWGMHLRSLALYLHSKQTWD